MFLCRGNSQTALAHELQMKDPGSRCAAQFTEGTDSKQGHLPRSQPDNEPGKTVFAKSLALGHILPHSSLSPPRLGRAQRGIPISQVRKLRLGEHAHRERPGLSEPRICALSCKALLPDQWREQSEERQPLASTFPPVTRPSPKYHGAQADAGQCHGEGCHGDRVEVQDLGVDVQWGQRLQWGRQGRS